MNKLEEIASKIGFKAENVKATKSAAIVSRKESGTLSLGLYPMNVIWKHYKNAAEFVLSDPDDEGGIQSAITCMERLSFINSMLHGKPTEVERDQVESMRDIVVKELDLAEANRKADSEDFDPDEYIGLKLFYFELKDWLSVDIISFDVEQQGTGKRTDKIPFSDGERSDFDAKQKPDTGKIPLSNDGERSSKTRYRKEIFFRSEVKARAHPTTPISAADIGFVEFVSEEHGLHTLVATSVNGDPYIFFTVPKHIAKQYEI